MNPARPRYSRINRTVAELLSANSVSAAPVPVERLAESVGARVVYREFDEQVSGVLVRHLESVVIGVASGQSKERQRFTVAHELGHLLLHEGRELRVDKLFRVNLRSPSSSRAEDIEEIEANAFAASLLMPSEFIHKDTAKVVLDVEDSSLMSALADRYEVSVQAMTFRVMNLFGKPDR